jgi:two-component system NarL family sensor kinase
VSGVAAARARSDRDTLRVLAVVRVAALPVLLAGEQLVAHPEPAEAAFTAILAVTAVYAAIALWLELRPGGPRIRGEVYAALDLISISALVFTSGGAFSQLRFAFVLLPLGAAFLFRPRRTALASVAAVLAFVAVSLPHPATEGSAALQFELVQALFLSWLGLAAVLLSRVLARRADRIEELAASRGRLVVDALEAEDRERRRLADALHDEAIQNLMAARQELDGALAGDEASADTVRVALERTVRQLRGTVFQLHPYLLEHAGLEPAVRAVAEEQGARAGFRWRVDVDPAATGEHDALLLSVARELLVNAAKHADATQVSVTLRRRGDAIELVVRDDGRGLDPERARAAPRAGHIGLASATERIEALGGRPEASKRPAPGPERAPPAR